MTKAVTVEIDDDTMRALERAAAEANREANRFIADALRTYVTILDEQSSEEEWEPSEEDLAAIRAGWEAAERGDLISHEDVMEGARRIIDGEAGVR